MTTLLDLPSTTVPAGAARAARSPPAAAGVQALRRAASRQRPPRPARSASARSSRCTSPAATLPDAATIAARPPSLWRYREWLPFEGEPVVSLDTGFTPLLDAPALARRLGVARVWVKNDAVSHPSLSFKDRVVATALNAALGLGLDTVGCASTGNLANAVAAQAARAGLPAWIFIPHDLELGKVVGTAVYGPHLVRVRGTYDDVNRLCSQVADRFGWGLVNINLRGYYGEGSKTMAFEIAEQLGWRLPTAVVAPMAGGSLLTKLDKGFREFVEAGLVAGAAAAAVRRAGLGLRADRAAGRARRRDAGAGRPEHDRALDRDRESRRTAGSPRTRSASTGGWAAGVSEEALVAGIRLLAETTGVFTETAGGVTVAGALALAEGGQLRPDDEVVLCITGNGLKTVEALQGALPEAPIIAPRIRELEALYGRDL